MHNRDIFFVVSLGSYFKYFLFFGRDIFFGAVDYGVPRIGFLLFFNMIAE